MGAHKRPREGHKFCVCICNQEVKLGTFKWSLQC